MEARLDLFPGPTLVDCVSACASLEATGTAVLATLRTRSQGGRFSGNETERLGLFRQALAHVSWADVEVEAAIAPGIAALVGGRPRGQLVISHHDFARTPPLPELLAIVDRCHDVPEAIAKVASAVRSSEE